MAKKNEMCALGFPAESPSRSMQLHQSRNLEVILPESHPHPSRDQFVLMTEDVLRINHANNNICNSEIMGSK
jgi:hypothetical protein